MTASDIHDDMLRTLAESATSLVGSENSSVAETVHEFLFSPFFTESLTFAYSKMCKKYKKHVRISKFGRNTYKRLLARCWQNKLIMTLTRFNSNRTAICRTNRHLYLKTYPTTVVLSNGATINIRYEEPRKLLKLPLDISTLSEAERKERILKRKPKKKIVIEEEIEDDFDVKSYSHLWEK